MSNISSWILSIMVAVLLGVLVEVLLPNGKLNNLLKSVISIFCMIVILSPLAKIDLNNINFSKFFGGINIDQNFVDDRKDEQISLIENQIENTLKLNGYQSVAVNIDGSFENNSLQIKSVNVDLERIVLSSQMLNINKYNNIMEIIKSVVNVKEEQVIFYE